jgi:hypothetical protein
MCNATINATSAPTEPKDAADITEEDIMTRNEIIDLVQKTLDAETKWEDETFEEVLKRIESHDYPPMKNDVKSQQEKDDIHAMTEHINYKRGMLNLAVKIMQSVKD